MTAFPKADIQNEAAVIELMTVSGRKQTFDKRNRVALGA